MVDVTQDLVKSIFNYHVSTGLLTWKEKSVSLFANEALYKNWVNRYFDKKAGYARKDGYEQVRISGKSLLTHRVVFLFCNGYLPAYVDHINGIRDDNRISNLRETTKSQNNCNRKITEKNKSGVKGVSWRKQSSKWVAQIQVNGKKMHIGLYSNIQDAKLAIMEVRKRLHAEFCNHGQAQKQEEAINVN